MTRLGFSMQAAHTDRGGAMARDSFDDADDRDEAREARRRRRRRRHREGRPLTDEERAWREAKRRVKARIGFYAHLIAYAGVNMLLFATPGRRAGPFLAIAWGIGLAFHYFSAIAAPDLRRRLIDREVKREVATGVSRERRAIETKHVRSLEDLSAQVAHEIRNPITAAKSLVQQMGEDPTSAENVGYAKVALEELDRVERSVAHLLRYAREEDLQLSEVSLGTVIDSALDTLRDRIDAQRVRLVREDGHDDVVRGDADKLRRVVINLVGNALDALAEGSSGQPILEVLAGENLAGTECWVRVRDNGPGIDARALAQIWSPFYSSKASGTGLGLAIAKKVVEAHGGQIEAASRPGAGAEFTVTLPRSHAEARS
jgi:signal transduction histidine kinase